MVMEPCAICNMPDSACQCNLVTLVKELSTIADNPIMCSVCKEKPPEKFGICFSCLADYGLNGTDPVEAEEEHMMQSSIGQVITEEENDKFSEVLDPDFEEDDFDDEDPNFDDWDEDEDDWDEEDDDLDP